MIKQDNLKVVLTFYVICCIIVNLILEVNSGDNSQKLPIVLKIFCALTLPEISGSVLENDFGPPPLLSILYMTTYFSANLLLFIFLLF